jgi:Rieske Fe-S protein
VNADCPASCPFVAAARPWSDLPVGQVRRVGSVSGEGPPPGEVDETKRNVLKLLAVAGVVGAVGGGLVGGSLQYAKPPLVGLSSFPRVQLLDIDGTPLTATKAMAEYSAKTSDLYTFLYPLRNEPNFLLNLYPAAKNVPGGVGPQGSIVAYSAICQHLGCPAPQLAYYPPGTCSASFNGKNFYIHCSCHGSTYDVANRAANLTGPAILPLPQVTLEVNPSDDTLYAVGVTGPPVNGHFDTLTGDYGVGSTSGLVKQAPTYLCP